MERKIRGKASACRCCTVLLSAEISFASLAVASRIEIMRSRVRLLSCGINAARPFALYLEAVRGLHYLWELESERVPFVVAAHGRKK